MNASPTVVGLLIDARALPVGRVGLVTRLTVVGRVSMLGVTSRLRGASDIRKFILGAILWFA